MSFPVTTAFVFSKFTSSPFASIPIIHLPNASITTCSNSTFSTRSAAYNNSHGAPFLASIVVSPITVSFCPSLLVLVSLFFFSYSANLSLSTTKFVLKFLVHSSQISLPVLMILSCSFPILSPFLPFSSKSLLIAPPLISTSISYDLFLLFLILTVTLTPLNKTCFSRHNLTIF